MTKPIQVVTRWQRFIRHTVWHPINTDPEDEDRWAPRFWFPTYDVIAIILGWYAFQYGSPLLNRLFPPWLTDTVAVVLIAAACVCLIGVVFPKLALMELIGKLSLVFLLGAYAGTVAFMTQTENNGFVVIVLIMSVWLLGPRVSKLFSMIPKLHRQRVAHRKRN